MKFTGVLLRPTNTEVTMPATITLTLVGIWFVVGLVTGIGWALGHVIVARLTGPARP